MSLLILNRKTLTGKKQKQISLATVMEKICIKNLEKQRNTILSDKESFIEQRHRRLESVKKKNNHCSFYIYDLVCARNEIYI